MFPINWNDVFRKKDGTLGTMEDLNGGGGSDLPEYDSGDAGKVLGVDEEGVLEWKELPAGTKIYYKDYTPGFRADEVIAKFSDGAASASSIHMAATISSHGVTVNGYTPISAIAFDVSTGYSMGIMLEYFVSAGQPQYYISLAFGNRVINSNSVRARVFYVKNEDVAALT